jgi:hypothetical protein
VSNRDEETMKPEIQKKATALPEREKRKRRLGLLDLEGQVDYYPEYDYKAARRHDMKRLDVRGAR